MWTRNVHCGSEGGHSNKDGGEWAGIFYVKQIEIFVYFTTLRALIFPGIKCCGINFCGTNFCNFGPKSQKLVPKMFPNSSNCNYDSTTISQVSYNYVGNILIIVEKRFPFVKFNL